MADLNTSGDLFEDEWQDVDVAAPSHGSPRQ